MEEKLRQLICEIGKLLYEKNLVVANDGNISVRTGDGFLCSPTGVSKGLMTPEMICKLDKDGNSLDDNKVSSEFKMHLRVYEKREDVNAVVHAHPPYATTYAIANEPLDRPITAEAIVAIGKVPVAPYGTPSTIEIPNNIEPLLKDNNAILLANHGALTYGGDLRQAFMRMETIEFYAREMFQAELLGRARELNAEELSKLKRLSKPY